MFTKQKLYLASLIVEKGLADVFESNLTEEQQQVCDCMLLDFIFRMENSKDGLQKIAVAWAISVYGRDATAFLVGMHARLTKEEIECLCDLYNKYD